MGRKKIDRRLDQCKDKLLDRIINQENAKELKELLLVYKILTGVIEEEIAKKRKK